MVNLVFYFSTTLILGRALTCVTWTLCGGVKRCHMCCRICVQMVSRKPRLHGEEKECIISKGLLEVLFCLLCESDSILEILYHVPGATLCYFCLHPPVRLLLYKI